MTQPTELIPSTPTSSNGTNGHTHDLIRGLVYTHNRANTNTAEVHQTSATLQAVVDLLIEQGLLEREALTARQQQAAEQLRGQYLARGMAVAMQEFEVSKYEFRGGAEVDCENRAHLCRAACCRLPLALSKEDVQEGLVQWDLGRPYMLARDEAGYCIHQDRDNCGCTVYARRPIPCRGYDCRKDQRIWLDFEDKVINPRIHEPDWPACLEVEETPTGGREDET